MSIIDFDSAVVERSRTLPVVVDFWASWCAPCRTLGPILDELASQAGGRWELVKLDTEEQPEVASRFGIRGIPAVKMFHDGEVVAEFVGALPAAEVRRWLQEHLPDPAQSRLDSIMRSWPEDAAGAAERIEGFLRENPDVPIARLRLAQAVVAHDPERARQLIEASREHTELAELASQVAALAELVDCESRPPEKLAPHLDGARRALREHDLDAALDHLIDAALTDNRFADGLAGRAAAALFRLIGPENELAAKHRRRLAMALHA